MVCGRSNTVETTHVSLHAAMPTSSVGTLQAGVIADLAHWDIERQEYTYGSCWDFPARDQFMLLEVKS